MSNLLSNAIQYGFPDSPIRLDLKGDSSRLTVMVVNEAIPIPAERIKSIFDPLTRGVAEDEPTDNLGLGLYITKEVVVAHDGNISVMSSEIEVMVFTARLPRSGHGPIPERCGFRPDQATFRGRSRGQAGNSGMVPSRQVAAMLARRNTSASASCAACWICRRCASLRKLSA